MRRKLLVLLFAISMVTCVCALLKVQSAQAQRTSVTDSTRKEKWEYCAIIYSGGTKEGNFAAGVVTIAYFDTSGIREDKVKIQGELVGEPLTNEYKNAQQKALAMTIAQLGTQGWEMIGQLPYNGSF